LKVAQACDTAFPERKGYFVEYYEESRTWMPAGFRDWTEHEVASKPNITIQVLPAIVHPAGASGFVITDTAAYAEHVIGGYVYTEPETVTRLDILLDPLRTECYRASESAAIIRRADERWTGEQVPTATPTARTA
jgi:hypothetical protein